MTPERKNDLELRMRLTIHHECSRFASELVAKSMSPHEVALAMDELAEIGACISTAFRATNPKELKE